MLNRRLHLDGSNPTNPDTSTNPDHIFSTTSPEYHIHLDVVKVYDESDTRYEELRASGFPARVIVQPHACSPWRARARWEGVQVVQTRLVFVKGGLLIIVCVSASRVWVWELYECLLDRVGE